MLEYSQSRIVWSYRAILNCCEIIGFLDIAKILDLISALKEVDKLNT